MEFASVYILEAPYHADREYDYFVPPEFDGVTVGSAVTVPFGRSNRKTAAIVVALKSEAERIIGSGQDLILEIEVDGGRQIKKLLGDDCVLIMLMAPNSDEQEKRLRERGTESDDVINGRLERTREEINEASAYDYIVVNENKKSSECAGVIVSIIKAEHKRYKRNKAFIENYFG